jgi:acyl-CoA thioester hydrolase
MSFSLTASTEIKVRFNECDLLGIVWHGHYLHYFEDGREAFGDQFGLSYHHIYGKGFVAPIVNVQCDFKKSLAYGDRAIVETIYTDSPAAKIYLNYKIYLPDNKVVVATGSSIQVFLDSKEMKLQLTIPDFFEEWKKKYS